MLLFVTNVLAILLAGGGVLILLGLAQASTAELQGSARRNVFIAILFGVFIVAIPLTLTGRQVVREALAQILVTQTTQEWLVGTEFELRGARVVGNEVYLTISGPGEPPPFDELVASLEKSIGSSATIELESVASQKQIHPGAIAAGP